MFSLTELLLLRQFVSDNLDQGQAPLQTRNALPVVCTSYREQTDQVRSILCSLFGQIRSLLEFLISPLPKTFRLSFTFSRSSPSAGFNFVNVCSSSLTRLSLTLLPFVLRKSLFFLFSLSFLFFSVSFLGTKNLLLTRSV